MKLKREENETSYLSQTTSVNSTCSGYFVARVKHRLDAETSRVSLQRFDTHACEMLLGYPHFPRWLVLFEPLLRGRGLARDL